MKKLIKILPYFIMLFITPIYNILDRIFFVEIFGCGCVPIAQTNMFNIDFNANDLRRLIYFIITLFMLILGLKLSKTMQDKKKKLVYNFTIVLFNFVLAVIICQKYLWG